MTRDETVREVEELRLEIVWLPAREFPDKNIPSLEKGKIDGKAENQVKKEAKSAAASERKREKNVSSEAVER